MWQSLFSKAFIEVFSLNMLFVFNKKISIIRNGAIEKTLNLEKKINIGVNKQKPSFLKIQKIKQKKTPVKGESLLDASDISKNNEIINEKNNDGMEEEIKNEEKKNNDENINKNNPDEIFFEEYGFTAIFELINELKKPLVGHFPILDLLFIYDAFIDDLPNNYVGFVKEINKIFPVLYDTKLIAKYFENHIDIKNSLEGLYFEVFEEEKKLKPFHNVILDESSFI